MPLQFDGERWTDVDGVRTHYFEAGAGTPILFVHGGEVGDESFAGSAQDWVFNFLPIADSGYRAIAVDLLGHGDTDNPGRDGDWSPRARRCRKAFIAKETITIVGPTADGKVNTFTSQVIGVEAGHRTISGYPLRIKILDTEPPKAGDTTPTG
jgi:pimeloyl-ACP methyl ester carboxylesterase